MTMRRAAGPPIALITVVGLTVTTFARGDPPVPPWVDSEEVPVPSWARAVTAKPGASGEAGDLELFLGPNGASGRRGVTIAGASLPMFGAKRGGGCTGAWWLVGPLAWACSDFALFSRDDPAIPAAPASIDALAHEYFFVRTPATRAYESLGAAQEGTADRELEAGWGVAVVEQRTVDEERWARTTKGTWIAMRDLVAARASSFHGEAIPDGKLDVAWVLRDHANVWASPLSPAQKSPPRDVLPRFRLVRVLEEAGGLVRIGEEQWMLAGDLARPTLSRPPSELARPETRWIDVELAAQTLVAYVGERPVYATIVSAGRGSTASTQQAGREGSPASTTITPRGVHRIWVKILGSDMSDLGRDDLDAHYSLEEVPYVQFFDGAVALHGTYWHSDFGREHSHGCVNLAPQDARWLFEFTGPRVPTGWKAAYPTTMDEGTAVRVR